MRSRSSRLFIVLVHVIGVSHHLPRGGSVPPISMVLKTLDLSLLKNGLEGLELEDEGILNDPFWLQVRRCHGIPVRCHTWFRTLTHTCHLTTPLKSHIRTGPTGSDMFRTLWIFGMWGYHNMVHSTIQITTTTATSQVCLIL